MKAQVKSSDPGRGRAGFTLIELLIVVAIIAILAAIAVPNFLEAQTRSKVSRVKADFRTMATALEAYHTDNTHYPLDRFFATYRSLSILTTPVAYMTSMSFMDPFTPETYGTAMTRLPPDLARAYQFFSYRPTRSSDANLKTWMDQIGSGYWIAEAEAYSLVSFGPDRNQTGAEWSYITFTINKDLGWTYSFLYDPSNGTVSVGDIIRFGGAVNMPAGFYK